MTLDHAFFVLLLAGVFVKERRGRGLQAQMIMLGLAVLLFFPALSAGELLAIQSSTTSILCRCQS